MLSWYLCYVYAILVERAARAVVLARLDLARKCAAVQRYEVDRS